ncbi:MAG: class I SAM-dependent methyltransferase [Proteobacteria bacterium]|nr:class I SAM-dependent methyltransferase [Pseudomonadota bacterium]
MASYLRNWLAPLRHTVLHPQWFAFREAKPTRQWVGKIAYGRVLDIGCADGWAKQALSGQCQYVGLDYPTTAQGIYGTRPDVFADGARLPFLDDSFDSVLLLEVLEHVAQPGAVLTEIRRVLKPGGVLLLSMPFLYPLHDAPHDYQRYTAPGLAHTLDQAGLTCDPPVARGVGFRAVALLAAIACAEVVVDACIRRRWRLLFSPALIAAVPVINTLGWLLGSIGGSAMLATGHRVVGHKP